MSWTGLYSNRSSLVLLLVLGLPLFVQARGTDAELPVVDLGERSTGQTYPISLSARNLDCEDPIDIRFDTEAIGWLRPLQEPVVEKVKPGEQASIKAQINLTGMAPGRYRGVLVTSCENCGFFIFKDCFVEQQTVLQISVREARPEEIAERSDARQPGTETEDDEAMRLPDPLPLEDPIFAGIGGAVSRVVGPGGVRRVVEEDGGCDEIRELLHRLEAEDIDCADEKAEVAAAQEALDKARDEEEAEANRQARIRSQYQAAKANYAAAAAKQKAAQAAVNAAQSKLNSARQAVLNAVAAHTGSSAPGWHTSPPQGMNVVQPGQSGGRSPPYAQAVPIGGNMTLYFVDDSGALWNPVNSRIAVSRLKQMLRFEIQGGQAMLNAVGAAQAALGAARQKLNAATANANRLQARMQAARNRVKALKPLTKAGSNAARQRLRAANAALDKCRERAAALASRIKQLQEALEECEKRVAARQAIREAEEKVEGSGKAVDEAEDDIDGMSGVDPDDAGRARGAADEAKEAQEEAEKKLQEAKDRLAGGDPEGAQKAAGEAGGAAKRAGDKAEEAKDKVEDAEREAEEEEEAIRRGTDVTPHPVNVTESQLKFNLGKILAELHRQALFKGMDDNCGRRNCEKAALFAAYPPSEGYWQAFAGILTDVFFAPLDVLSGGGLRGLAVELGKALVKSLIGNASLSEAAARAVFKFVGGELFPKLVNSAYAGGKINELVQGGLDELMEEEGVIVSTWEKEDFELPCRNGPPRRVNVKATMMTNPATGWVVLIIKLDDCPPVIVKYRVDDGGVPVYGTEQVKVVHTTR